MHYARMLVELQIFPCLHSIEGSTSVLDAKDRHWWYSPVGLQVVMLTAVGVRVEE